MAHTANLNLSRSSELHKKSHRAERSKFTTLEDVTAGLQVLVNEFSLAVEPETTTSEPETTPATV